MIIDSHTHIADRFTGFWQPLRYGRVQDGSRIVQAMPPSFDPPASPPELLLAHMDEAGVDRAFLLQHHLYGDQHETVLRALRTWPDRFVGFCYLGSFEGLDLPDRLERRLEQGFFGLKVELPTTRRLRADFRFDGEREWRVWERLQVLGRPLALDLCDATPADVDALRRLMETFPRLRVLNCHVGWAVGEGWQARALLNGGRNLWVDVAFLTGLYGPGQEYPYPQAQAVIRWAVETLGADRVMWGSDYPGALRAGTYPQTLDYVRRHCDFLSAGQKAQVLGGAALEFLEEMG